MKPAPLFFIGYADGVMADDSSTTIVIDCPAKLNLTLAVAPARADGLHPIASVMAALQFADTIGLRRCAGASTFRRAFDERAPKPHPIDWPIEEDLAYRAHARMQHEANKSLPIHCEIIKRIPAGSGLGGGSSNAAGMLIGLRDLFGLDVPDRRLLEIGASLGADVAFAVHALLGQAAALVTGIGEVIEPLDHLPRVDCVLVFPDGQCPTAGVYRAFDQIGRATDQLEPLIDAWRRGGAVPGAHNDLTEAALRVCPGIKTAMSAIKSQQIEPRLTGSGSALFVIVESQQHAVAIAETFGRAGLKALPTRVLGRA